MKKLILIVAVSLGVGFAFAEVNSNINFNARVEKPGAAHRIVVLIDPDSFSGGTTLLDQTYSVTGSSSEINASVNIMII